MAKLNITQAAREWGIARTTLQRAVTRGHVAVTTLENGLKSIDSSEMIRVYGAANGRSAVSLGAARVTAVSDVKLEMFERENRLLRDRVDDLKKMLDDKENVIKNQREMLTTFFTRLAPPKRK
jgi:predicted site-specific integrase-resolvase